MGQACDEQARGGEKSCFSLPSFYFIPVYSSRYEHISVSMATTRQETFCTVSSSPSSILGRASPLGTELTFSSCSRAMHTCQVRLSNLFNTPNAETKSQVPWCLHIPYETTILRSNWPSSSPSTLCLPQHLRSSKYTLKSLQCR